MPRTAPANPLFLRDEAIDGQFELWLLAGAGLNKICAELLSAEELDQFDLFMLAIVARHQGQTMADLVEISGRPKQILSRRIQIMEGRGLIERTCDPNDRRRRLLQISQTGGNLMDQIMQKMRRYLRRSFSQAGSEAVDGFSSVLIQMAEPKAAWRFGHGVANRK